MVRKCQSCPREAMACYCWVANYGRIGGYLLETIYLCESCALLRDDIEWDKV